MIYVGGAVVSLYVNDPAAEDIRPTKDLDISVSVATFSELERLREELISKGFFQTSEDDVICRFRFDDVKVDVMNTTEIGWAPANPWFAAGFERREKKMIDEQAIYILPFAYFLATKFSAFISRGNNDPIMSHDFEDIVYLLDNRMDFVEQIQNSPDDVSSFLKEQFALIVSDRTRQEAVEAHLFYEHRARRYARILDLLRPLIS